MKAASDTETLDWTFPLPEPGCGVLLGNGTMGLMIWGMERLHVTVGRNGFWDRRGGAVPRVGATYQELKRRLEAGDVEGAGRLFTDDRPADAPRPTQLPCARLELIAQGWKPHTARLEFRTGLLRIEMARSDGSRASVLIDLSRDREIAWLECDPALGEVALAPVPMWNFLGDKLEKSGCTPPEVWRHENGGGILQHLPDDPSLALAWERQDRTWVLGLVLGGEDPRTAAEALVRSSDIPALGERSRQWWDHYWRDMPQLDLPDEELQHAFLYGAFLQAGLTPAEGVAATLVGPWMEESLWPAWANDYHFNINVQMIYWPCLATNRSDHLGPLWNLIRGWFPQLRQNAERFFEVDGALMLPHAVDDRGHTVDSFWMGMIDHGCTAWMAQLAWLHYRYSMDPRVLTEIAWPLLNGAFNGYWAMAEQKMENGRACLSLPITVSPEYGPPDGNAWGRNASFQLSAFHLVSQLLRQAAEVLGEPVDPRWARVQNELPPYTLAEGSDVWQTRKKVPHIGMWEGQDLNESHRHHSNLAGIYPFATLDPRAPETRELMIATLQNWIAKGTGYWSGWSLPWAATLCARCDLPDAGIAWLHWWRDVYNNLGHGSDHNADFAGCTVFGRGYILPKDPNERYRPCIQLDGAMGTITAILELLVQCRADGIVILPRIPRRWENFSFDGIRTEGAFLAGATVRNGHVVEVRLTSLAGGPLRLHHGLGAHFRLQDEWRDGPLLETQTYPGQRLVLSGLSG